MKTEASQSLISEELVLRDAKLSGSKVLSVKAVAFHLGVSRSTVYRIDRLDGPFRFIIDGRRIFVDAASFEIYLSNAGTLQLSENPVSAEIVPTEYQLADIVEAMPLISSRVVGPPEVARQSATSLPEGSAGQRELMMRQSNGPSFFSYPAFL